MKKCITCLIEIEGNQKKFCSYYCHNEYRKIRPTGYHGLHKRVYAKFGKAQQCEMCKTKKGRIEWANKSGKYENNLYDWLQLCTSCHKQYDHSLKYKYQLFKEYICNTCKKIKNISDFYKDASRKSGHESICKDCNKLKNKERNKKMTILEKKIKAKYLREWRLKNKTL